MIIGVICTSAPSFSKTLQEQLPLYQRFKSVFQSSFRSVGGLISKLPARSSSGYERRDSHQHGDHVSSNERLAGSIMLGDRESELHGCNFVHNNEHEDPGALAKVPKMASTQRGRFYRNVRLVIHSTQRMSAYGRQRRLIWCNRRIACSSYQVNVRRRR